MQISIKRRPSANGATISTWYVDGQWQCFGCEDVVRGATEAKVYGKTAIPAGTYRVLVTFSNRFQKPLPLLVDLPGKRTLFGNLPISECGIRIHPGNTPADTEGCLLPGTGILPAAAGVSNSRVAFEALFAKINAAVARHEEIHLTIG